MGKYKHILLYFYDTLNFIYFIFFKYKLSVSCLILSLSTSLMSYGRNTLADHSLSPSLDDFHSETTPFNNHTQHTENTLPFFVTLVRKQRKENEGKQDRGLQRQEVGFTFCMHTYVHTHTFTPVISVLPCVHSFCMFIQQANKIQPQRQYQ